MHVGQYNLIYEMLAMIYRKIQKVRSPTMQLNEMKTEAHKQT